jgi:hypothetical protein
VGTVTLRPSSHYTSRTQLKSVDQHTPLVEYLNEYHFLLFLNAVMEQQLLVGRIVKNRWCRAYGTIVVVHALVDVPNAQNP